MTYMLVLMSNALLLRAFSECQQSHAGVGLMPAVWRAPLLHETVFLHICRAHHRRRHCFHVRNRAAACSLALTRSSRVPESAVAHACCCCSQQIAQQQHRRSFSLLHTKTAALTQHLTLLCFQYAPQSLLTLGAQMLDAIQEEHFGFRNEIRRYLEVGDSESDSGGAHYSDGGGGSGGDSDD